MKWYINSLGELEIVYQL